MNLAFYHSNNNAATFDVLNWLTVSTSTNGPYCPTNNYSPYALLINSILACIRVLLKYPKRGSVWSELISHDGIIDRIVILY